VERPDRNSRRGRPPYADHRRRRSPRARRHSDRRGLALLRAVEYGDAPAGIRLPAGERIPRNGHAGRGASRNPAVPRLPGRLARTAGGLHRNMAGLLDAFGFGVQCRGVSFRPLPRPGARHSDRPDRKRLGSHAHRSLDEPGGRPERTARHSRHRCGTRSPEPHGSVVQRHDPAAHALHAPGIRLVSGRIEQRLPCGLCPEHGGDGRRMARRMGRRRTDALLLRAARPLRLRHSDASFPGRAEPRTAAAAGRGPASGARTHSQCRHGGEHRPGRRP